MTVRIPISADPAPVVSAFTTINQAIRRSGQEGKAFADLDLSHPEVKELANDLRVLQRNYEELQRVGRGASASAVRKGKYKDVLDWYENHGRQFPDANDRRKHMAQVGKYVSQGSSFEPKEPGEGDPENPENPDDKGGGGVGALKSALPMMKGLVLASLAMAGVGGIFSTISGGVKSSEQEAIGIDDLMRKLNDTDIEFGKFRENLQDASKGLMLTYDEAVKLSTAFATAANSRSAANVLAGVQAAAGLARSFGMDPNSTSNVFGQMQFRGVSTGDKGSQRELALMFADAINSGKMFAKGDEVIQAIIRFVTASERVMVHSPNVAGFAAMEASMNASGMPGLKGDLGDAIVAQINQAIQHGGNFGPAGQNFMWRALNPEGSTRLDPYQTTALEQEGAFGSRASLHKFLKSMGVSTAGIDPHDTTTNFQRVMAEANQMYGANPLKQAEGLGNLFGISIEQALAMMRLKPTQFGGLGKMLKDYKINLSDLNPTGIEELGDIASAHGNMGELKKLRDHLMSTTTMTDQEKSGMLGATNPDELSQMLANAVAKSGRSQTDGSRTLQSIDDFKNSMTRIGNDMLTGINTIRDYVAKLAGITADGKITESASHTALGRAISKTAGAQGGGWSSVGNAMADDDYFGIKAELDKKDKAAAVMPAVIPTPAKPIQIHVTTEVVHKNQNGEVLNREVTTTSQSAPVPHHG